MLKIIGYLVLALLLALCALAAFAAFKCRQCLLQRGLLLCGECARLVDNMPGQWRNRHLCDRKKRPA